MGIRGLSTALKPYAVPNVIGCKTPGCKQHTFSQDGPTSVIIDGPAFAYCIYHRIYTGRPYNLDSIEAVPSYNELARGALLFLNEMEAYGVDIEKIYFDGYLPHQKQGIRIERLEKSINQLSIYRSDHAQGSGSVVKQSGVVSSVPKIVFASDAPFSSSKRPHIAAPFVVFAILDAIRHSKYASVCSLVPGEADLYCAQAARESGGIVLSNDSDLFVHDLGSNGALVFLNDLDLQSSNIVKEAERVEACHVLKASVFRPQSIPQRLGLECIQHLGYAYKKHERDRDMITLPKAITEAQDIEHSPGAGFAEFRDAFLFDPLDPAIQGALPQTLAQIKKCTDFLDPRVSELVFQVLLHPRKEPKVYLPILLDDTSRSSAWLVSASHRTLAYSLCMSLFQPPKYNQPPPTKILEHNRKSRKITPHQIPLLPEPTLLSSTTNLLTRLQTFTHTFSTYPQPLIFVAYALAETYHWYLFSGKTPPSRPIMTALLTGRPRAQPDWQHIHLSAQIQAVLYSLLMIKQILSLAISTTSQPPIPAEIVALSRFLTDDLPRVSQLIRSGGEMAGLTVGLDVDGFLDAVAGMLGDEYAVEEEEEVVGVLRQSREDDRVGDGADGGDVARGGWEGVRRTKGKGKRKRRGMGHDDEKAGGRGEKTETEVKREGRIRSNLFEMLVPG